MKPQLLLSALLVATLGLGACADGVSIESVGQQNSPPPPSNQPDETVVTGSESTGGNGGNGGNTDTEEHEETAPEPTSDRSDRFGAGGEPIPEPGTFLLLGSGLAAAAYYRRRKHGVAQDVDDSSDE